MMQNIDLNGTNTSQSSTSGQITADACLRTSCIFSMEERIAIALSLTFTFVISITGNIAVCYRIVRTSKHLRSTTNLSLLNLALADLLVTIFCIPTVTVTIYFADNEWLFTLPGCKIVIFLQNVATDASICNLLVTSTEKILGACAPFYFRSRRKRVRYLLPLSWLIGVVESSVYLKYKTLVEFPDGRQHCIEIWPSVEVQRGYNIAHSVLFCFLPLILMAIFHTITAVKINGSAKRMAHGRGRPNSCSSVCIEVLNRKRKAVTMLILIVASFAICVTPVNMVSMWALLGNHDQTYILENMRLLHIMYAVSLCLYFFNSACHPLIYAFMKKPWTTSIPYAGVHINNNESNV